MIERMQHGPQTLPGQRPLPCSERPSKRPGMQEGAWLQESKSGLAYGMACWPTAQQPTQRPTLGLPCFHLRQHGSVSCARLRTDRQRQFRREFRVWWTRLVCTRARAIRQVHNCTNLVTRVDGEVHAVMRNASTD